MKRYEASMTLFSGTGEDKTILDFLDAVFQFQSEEPDVKNKLLAECRKKLQELNLREVTSVLIFCVPISDTGEVADAAELIRSRHKFSSIASIMNVSAEDIFFKGYGPEARGELFK